MKKMLSPGSLLLLCGLLTATAGYSQNALPPSSGDGIPAMVKPTESATAQTRYGDVPVNLSTGQPTINVPLHTLSFGSLSVPITLNYDASGVKVDNHPTWVGQNMNLRAEGVITRSVKGMPDDYLFHDPNGSHFANTEKGYLFSGNKLDNNDWKSANSQAQYAFYEADANVYNPNYLADGIPDDFSFQFGGYSGTFFLDEKGIWRVKSQTNLGLEISHEVNTDPVLWESDPSTGFEIKIKKMITKFTIITPDGTKYIFGGDIHAIDYSRGLRDGRPFNDAGNLCRISPSAWHLTQIIPPVGPGVSFNYEWGPNLIRYTRPFEMSISSTSTIQSIQNAHISLNATILTPSYLTSIETPTEKVLFHRSFSTQTKFEGILWENTAGNLVELKEFDKQMWDNSNLGQMIGGGFDRGWPDFRFPRIWNVWPNLGQTGMGRYPDLSPKLDSFQVITLPENALQKTVKFYYNNIATERLFLDSLDIKAPNSNISGDKYKFRYLGREQVPAYTSFYKDQWGYNNGINYITSGDLYASPWRPSAVSFCRIGTLQEIVYPTGGTTSFEFELNTYSKVQKVTLTSPFGGVGTVSLESVANTNAGGLRIKKITSTAGFGSPPVIKSYAYLGNYAANGSQSSGILSSRSQYDQQTHMLDACDPGFSYLAVFSDNQYDPFGEDVQMVTYSEVNEISSDNSRKTFKYSNYDNPDCLDEMNEAPFMFNVVASNLYKLTSNSLERGLLLSEEYYNSSNQKVYSKLYEYDYANDRKDQYAKCIQRFDQQKQRILATVHNTPRPCQQYFIFRLYPFKKYYYNIPLKKVTEHSYDGGADIATSTTYVYDNYGSVTNKTTTTSNNKQYIESTKYNSHPDFLNTAISLEAQGIRNLFTNYKIKNYPVERLTLVGPQPTSGGGSQLGAEQIVRGSLQTYDPTKPLPSKAYALELEAPFQPISYNLPSTQPIQHFVFSLIDNGYLAKDSKYQLQTTINAYTFYPIGTLQKPIDITAKTSNMAYTWDYHAQFQTSFTQNASATQVAYSSFEGSYLASGTDQNRGNWDFDKTKIIAAGFTGTRCMELQAGDLITSVPTLANGKTYVVSFWAKGNQPRLQLGGSLVPVMYAPVREAAGWKFYRITVTGNGTALSVVRDITQPGNMQVDELRLYPLGAIMQSYTYDPVIGQVTSAADEAGKVTFMQYDTYGRLIRVKDESGNIIKQHTYQLQGPQ